MAPRTSRRNSVQKFFFFFPVVVEVRKSATLFSPLLSPLSTLSVIFSSHLCTRQRSGRGGRCRTTTTTTRRSRSAGQPGRARARSRRPFHCRGRCCPRLSRGRRRGSASFLPLLLRLLPFLSGGRARPGRGGACRPRGAGRRGRPCLLVFLVVWETERERKEEEVVSSSSSSDLRRSLVLVSMAF